MSMDRKDDRAREAIVEQASAWFLRHRSGELSMDEKGEFLEWLRASKLNMEEYLEQVRLHQALTHIVPGLQLDRERLLAAAHEEFRTNILSLNAELAREPTVSPRQARRSRIFLTSLAALLLAVIGALWVWRASLDTQRINVPHGEQRIVQLPDGSTLHVNVSSRVDVKYTERDRIIELDKGQAFFEVAHEAKRPFRVRAGDAEVIAVGTQFDVYRRDDNNVIVTVTQGAVEVGDPQWTREDAHTAGTQNWVRVTAGEQLQVGGTASAPRIRPADVRAATAWMRREVIFNGESLAAVAEEINRYVAVPVRIDDEHLKQMRVRAVFNAYDSESFLAFLKQYDVEVDARPNGIHVYKRAPGSISPN